MNKIIILTLILLVLLSGCSNEIFNGKTYIEITFEELEAEFKGDKI